jgi:hypothetical protein
MDPRKTKYSTADERRFTQIKFEKTSGAVSPKFICVYLRSSAVGLCFRVNSRFCFPLVRRPAHGVSATALQEIEVGAEVGLQDVIVIKTGVTACRRFCRLPGFASPI